MFARQWILLPLVLAAGAGAQQYAHGPDSERHEGTPRGTLTKFTWKSGQGLFPKTTRDYWVYVPAQYEPEKPACLMVFQDGSQAILETGDFRVPIVFDNLISKGSMPVTIGVFINPGELRVGSGESAVLLNRSFEYDDVDDRYARFLTEELLPQVTKHWNISLDPNDRAIAGVSSGGIAAFTAAMLHPEFFHRVLSFIGSYANLRGGNVWPDLVRKMEPAPLRVFLQDGNHDLNIFGGDWWLSNQAMNSALEYRGYEVKFVTGTEGHNGKHGGAILPEALSWLWHDWPTPIKMPERKIVPGFADVSQVLDPAASWELVGSGYGFTEGPAVDREGTVYFVDVKASRIYRVDPQTGEPKIFREDAGGASGLMFGKDGRLYAAQNGKKRIVAYEADGRETVLAENVGSNDLAVSTRGDVYFTDPSTKQLWLVDAKGQKRAVQQGLQFPNGIRFTADERLLMVADSATRWVWEFPVLADGSLGRGEPFYRLELPLTNEGKLVNTWPDGLAFDTQGNLYAAAKGGIQICDQVGRVFGILRKPSGADPSNLVFGGPDFHTLYVTAKDKVFRRRLLTQGYLPWAAPKWPAPHL